MFFLQDDISFGVSSSTTNTFPCLVDFIVRNIQQKTIHFSSSKPTSVHFIIFNHTKWNNWWNNSKSDIHTYLVYLQSKPLMQCNVKDWSSNNLKIKREIKFNLFLKSSLIRYVIFLLHVFFMNEKRFPLKISHKFYFKFTVSTEIFSQQK